LKFPLITQPMFDVLNVIPLPTPNYGNSFIYTEVANKLIAVNKETRTYLILRKQDLNECTNNNNLYLCDKNQPIYHVNENTPCEAKIYVQGQNYRNQCNISHKKVTRAIWITL
ncbi:hypothetical protein EAG_09850, partial [Camponotus floridanus]